AAGWLLTEKATQARYFMVFLICALVAVVTCIGVLPWSVTDALRRPMGLVLLIVTLALLGYSVYLSLGALWKATVVTAGQIIGSLNLYLFLGMCWAYVYALVTWFDPGSFDLPPSRSDALSSLIYFSFVTLASLGYGDIVPKTPFAQRLAIAEAITGQFYTAVLVAYLISIHIGNRSMESGAGGGTGPSRDQRP
ncbi:MAG: potassium channel family protein, partial [Pseudomonadota bacterium]